MAKFRPISDAAFQRAQAKADRDPTPFARAVSKSEAGCVRLRLNTGAFIEFNPHSVKGLKNASPRDLAEVALEGGGTVLVFPKLDVYLSIGPLLEQFFGPMEWGRRERRAEASRANGKKGGRPPKIPETEAVNQRTHEHAL